MRKLFLGLALAIEMAAQPLPGTRPLEISGDPAKEMVDGIMHWLEAQTAEAIPHRAPSRERLRTILGVVDQRVPFDAPELVATTKQDALVAETGAYRVYAVRWPVLDGMNAEGLLFEPRGKTVARVVALPDADQLPEQLAAAQVIAGSGCQVLAPVLINRKDTWSANTRLKKQTNFSHREFIYRMAFEVGRHIIGYEVQKTLAAVDWFSAQPEKLPVGVWGYGEGGGVALYAAALDERIRAAGVSGYFQPREGLWKQPIDRNVFGLLRDFGDAELAAMAAPRTIVVDTAAGPTWSGNPEAGGRRFAAPGVLEPVTAESAKREAQRARALRKDTSIQVSADGVEPFLRALGTDRRTAAHAAIPVRDPEARMHRQFAEMLEFTQGKVRLSQPVRDELWASSDGISDPQKWVQTAPALRAKLWDEVLGRLPASRVPLNLRTRKSYSGAKWDGYEVAYDIQPGVIGYGVLLLPRDIQPGERRPVLVGQHGLQHRPQYLFGQEAQDRDPKGAYTNFHFYQNIGDTFANLGYVVYLPQNPYIGDFRPILRLANPQGWSLYSFILQQDERLLDWLGSLAYVDPARIGYYGLSYGGKTALRIPALLDRFALSVCSGDFNEWVTKVAAYDIPQSYMYTIEYDMLEFNLGGVANHGEIAKLIAPRPFMVERGHRDGVGIDEMVAAEYSKVRRFYDEMGIGDRTGINFFNGPHMMHAVETVAFIRKYLGR
jgi:dienelactone hydrolase